MIKVFEAFAGIGTQRMALENLGVEHEVVAIAEIDKFAIASYEAIHGKVNNLGDISKINTEDIPDHDLFTYSFPCQDISVAGQQKGLDKGSDTRSGLLWECEKVIRVKRPKYLLMENVKNLVGKKHKSNFDKWLVLLEELGYTNYWKVLNAKDYGVPQNRERVFCISILNDTQGYEFPDSIELDIRLKDLLEDEVDEKFYLSQEQVDKITFNTFKSANRRIQEKDYCDALLARDFKDPKCVRIGGIFDTNGKTHQAGSIWDKEQLSPTLDTMQGGWRQPSVLIKNNTKQGYLEATEGDGIDLAFINSNTRRGRVQKGISQTLDTGSEKGVLVAKKEFGRMGKQACETVNENNVKHGDTINPFNKSISSDDGISPTLTTRPEGFKTAISVVEGYTIIGSTQKHAAINNDGICPTLTSAMGSGGGHVPMHDYDFRIRKLTPLECWRLMGISDEDFYKAQKVNSNSQLYKQAGNAIVVNVLEAIFSNLF